eukprot:gene8443-2313_t
MPTALTPANAAARADATAHANAARAAHATEWDAAVAQSGRAGVEALWTAFNTIAEDYMCRRAGDTMPPGTAQRHTGRAKQHEPRKMHIAPPQRSRDDGAQTTYQRRLLNTLGRTQKLHQLLANHAQSGQPGALPHLLHVLWKRIHRSLSAEPLCHLIALDAARAAQGIPTRLLLATVADTLTARYDAVTASLRTKRIHDWKERMKDAALNHRTSTAPLFAWCNNKPSAKVTSLVRDDGTVTANISEMDRILRDAWLPIFDRYANSPEPDWPPFRDRFREFIVRRPMTMKPLTAADLAKTIARMKTKQAGGMDGWRAHELKHFPAEILELLAGLFNRIESTGEWPEALQRALVTLIPKGAGGRPLQLRPITVTSTIYRLWAGTRVREVMQWQESWLVDGQRGFRVGNACDDLYWSLALRIEEAILTGTPLVGISADWAKCFDRVPHGIMLALLEETGLHAGILRPLRTMYRRLRRRFRVNGAVGEAFASSQGVMQGCPLSVAGLAVMMAVWSRAAEHAGAATDSYADDCNASATGATVAEATAKIQRVADVTEEF